MIRTSLLAAAAAVALLAAAPASAAMVNVTTFQDRTGIKASGAQLNTTWQSLQTMGTTQYLGGVVGSFKLDEASMLAGALTLGASEFDNFLRSGTLSTTSQGLGGVLSTAMGGGAGINLGQEIGSFTSGGGFLNGASGFASLISALGASTSGGMCDPEVANQQAMVGKARVDSMVNAAMSTEYGFSQISSLTSPTGTGSGFSALSCIDKLFQNAGSDVLFKPPTLSSLTSMLQNWSCAGAVSVATQIASQFGSGETFNTGGLGGFFPALSFGEALDGRPSERPGMGLDAATIFGATFGTVQTASSSEISSQANINRIFMR